MHALKQRSSLGFLGANLGDRQANGLGAVLLGGNGRNREGGKAQERCKASRTATELYRIMYIMEIIAHIREADPHCFSAAL
ncbi:MAG: hypothetical protein JNM29_20740 [Candidatus Odyssella sp.]|nr:hypothetical protein [Candidatus Odyssella sp.]